MNIFRRIKRIFIPEWHTFLLKRGDDMELRVYKNGNRVSNEDLLKSKKGSEILKDYLNEQQAKESEKSKKNSKEKQKRTY
jgi:hypothetical protein